MEHTSTAPGHGYPVPVQSQSAAERLELGALWKIVLKHKGAILGLALAMGLLAALVAYSLEPVYQSSTTLLVETASQGYSPIGEDSGGGWFSYLNRQAYLQTQILLIGSRTLAVEVIDRLAIWDHPELDPRKQAPRRARFQLDIGRLLPWLAADEEPIVISAEAARAAAIAKVQGGISAELVPDSEIIRLRFRGHDPQLVTRIVNAYAEAYIEMGLETRLLRIQQATSWLNGRVAGLREQLAESEDALQAYRETHGLIDTAGLPGLSDQELSDLSQRLAEAKSRRDDLDAQVTQARTLRQLDYARFAASPVVSANPVIATLKTEEVTAEREVQELSKRYGERHPKMIAAREDLRTVRARLAAELSSAVAGLTRERDIARNRVAQIERELGGVKENVQAVNRKEFELAALEREVDANRELYELFMTRFKETDVGADLESTNARVIDAALGPGRQIKPHHIRIIAATVILGLLLGIGLAFALEHLDNTLKTGEDVEESLQLPMLGTMPLISSRRRRGIPMARLALTDSKSEFAEAVRTIRTGLVLSGLDEPRRIVLITSTVPGEGKTTLAANLAMALAGLERERVLLIDADLRRAALSRAFPALTGARGLSDFVSGSTALEDCIHHDEEADLDLMPSGTLPPNPLELLSSRRFGERLAELVGRYDRVLIDSAPTQAVSDALILAHHCDAVLFLIKADATPLPLVEIAVKRLRQVSAPLVGAVLNQFDNRRSARYGHYQYGRYRRYSYAYGGYSGDYAKQNDRQATD